MGYIRLKRINTNIYSYYVESINTKQGPRQRVKKYLGRVYELTKSKDDDCVIVGNTKKKFFDNLVGRELSNHGFKNNKYQNIIYLERSITKASKDVTLKVNDGYLASFTLGRIFNFKKSNDLEVDAVKLANLFVQAGLTVSEEEFVKFYQFF